MKQFDFDAQILFFFAKFRFLSQILICSLKFLVVRQNYDFCPELLFGLQKFRFFTKNLIYKHNFDLSKKIYFTCQISSVLFPVLKKYYKK